MAEVVGYGGAPSKMLEGGQVAQQWAPTPSWNRRIVIDGQTVTDHYLTDYGYPDYVNSDVVTVQQVAHKALEAYMASFDANLISNIPMDSLRRKPLGQPVWPEDNPKDGLYQIPAPVPAPVPAPLFRNVR